MYYRARTQTNKAWDKKLIETIRGVNNESFRNTKIVFLNKKFSPKSDIYAASKMIDYHIRWGRPYSKILLIPSDMNSEIKDYPFTYSFMA